MTSADPNVTSEFYVPPGGLQQPEADMLVSDIQAAMVRYKAQYNWTNTINAYFIGDKLTASSLIVPLHLPSVVAGGVVIFSYVVLVLVILGYGVALVFLGRGFLIAFRNAGGRIQSVSGDCFYVVLVASNEKQLDTSLTPPETTDDAAAKVNLDTDFSDDLSIPTVIYEDYADKALVVTQLSLFLTAQMSIVLGIACLWLFNSSMHTWAVTKVNESLALGLTMLFPATLLCSTFLVTSPPGNLIVTTLGVRTKQPAPFPTLR